MIQRSKLGLNFFSLAFSTPCLSLGPVNRSDAWHITVALPAQKGCAQTISANVLKKLRRRLQRRRRVDIELCVKLSLLRLFHVGHVAQNRRSSALSLALHGCHFTLSFGRLRQNIAPKSVPHVRHDYFSSFSQSNHWFVVLLLTLPSSNLKLPN